MNRMLCWFLLAISAFAVDQAAACDQCGHGVAVRCDICGCECCPCEMTQQTVMESMCVTETRMKVQIVKTMKEREESYTVFKCVPEKRTFTKESC